MKITFLKQRKPKRFNFKPRYYEPKKEEFNARVESIEREVAREKKLTEKFGGEEQYRAKMRRVTNDAINLRRSQNKKSNMRILLVAGILIAFFYIYLNVDL